MFDELKIHQRGPGVALRSETPDGVIQEVYGRLCVQRHLLPAAPAATVSGHDPVRLSFIRTLRTARRTIGSHPGLPPEPRMMRTAG
ncbi:hypothetical protein [Rhodococcus opacus]|uniref:hypothetical protein n=1 Tax=Rhodococcus opacus TaxID=37919 RepID=UPI0034D2FB18